jgi:formate--tetrahydrofolate ligase
MKTDIEIAQEAKILPIQEVAQKAGLMEDEIEPYGKFKAKVNFSANKRLEKNSIGKLILVTTITPTPQGEGKTTVTIGLGQGLAKLGRKTIICLREPSLGPCMGLKGGAAGGGYSQVLPMEDINLHFTGDSHMISAGHNLLAAMLDNHIHFGNALEIDTRKVFWRRIIDMNDRSLRKIIVGLGEGVNGILREDGFDITASSEVMAILCMAESISDMKNRLAKIIVGENYKRLPVFAKELQAEGAMALLLKDALKPNLVQSIEGVPAFVHGGPFANIAHGCNSLIATKLGLKLGEFVVTEAGFGADLGAEKFFNIKCRQGNLNPHAVVLVVTIKALKRQGGLEEKEFKTENLTALEAGLINLQKHLENIKKFNVPCIPTINKFDYDSEKEINLLRSKISSWGYPVHVCEVQKKGGEGAKELAQEIILLKNTSNFKSLYDLNLPLKKKIETIALSIYGAEGVEFSAEANRDLAEIDEMGFGNLPICVAKTQFSFSDDSKKLGVPKGYKINVKGAKASAGAGFVVVYTGNILTMPGLPRHPAAENMNIDSEGRITGLF